MNIFDALPLDLKKHTFQYIKFKQLLHDELLSAHSDYTLDTYPYMRCGVCDEYKSRMHNWCLLDARLLTGFPSMHVCGIACFETYRDIQRRNFSRMGFLPEYEMTEILRSFQRSHYPDQLGANH